MFDPIVRETIQNSTRSIVKATIGIFTVFPIMLCLFFGVGWSPKDNYKGVQVAIINLDHDIIGQAIEHAAKNPSFPLTPVFVTDAIDLNDVRRRVNLGEFNGALVANANASALLHAALHNATAHYVPSGAATFVFDEGRGGSSMALILRCVVGVFRQKAKMLFPVFSADSCFFSAVSGFPMTIFRRSSRSGPCWCRWRRAPPTPPSASRSSVRSPPTARRRPAPTRWRSSRRWVNLHLVH
jgi:hypothetical protein